MNYFNYVDQHLTEANRVQDCHLLCFMSYVSAETAALSLTRLSPFAVGFVKCPLVFVLDLARIKEVGILGERLSLQRKAMMRGPTEHFIYNQKNVYGIESLKSINHSKVTLKSKQNKNFSNQMAKNLTRKLQEDDIDHLKTLIGWLVIYFDEQHFALRIVHWYGWS